MKQLFVTVATLLLVTATLYGQDAQPLGSLARGENASVAREDETARYMDDVRKLLNEERFAELDQVAAAARSHKDRLPGGAWKLYTLYHALAEPPDGREAADAQWATHLGKLQRWASLRRNSITPWVALAHAYVNYGWKARGNDYADKVTDEGWKLFAEREDLARTTLERAAALTEKCPHWYWVEQKVALAQGWDRARATHLFEQAIAFEPAYYYYYLAYTVYLLPKWYGEEGEAEQFADAASARMGGNQGRALYYSIAAGVGCHCSNETFLTKLSWPRIQQGYAALVELYGTSTPQLNRLAYIAVRMNDPDVAQQMFQRIGEDWDKETWRTRKFFDDCKAWASRMSTVHTQAASAAVDSNMLTTEGRQYDGRIAQEFGKKFATRMKQCVDGAGHDLGSFDLFVRVKADGAVQQVLTSRPTAVSNCLLPQLQGATFAPPPKPLYWVKISMNIQP